MPARGAVARGWIRGSAGAALTGDRADRGHSDRGGVEVGCLRASSIPQLPQAERARIEWPDAHRLVVACGPTQLSGVVRGGVFCHLRIRPGTNQIRAERRPYRCACLCFCPTCRPIVVMPVPSSRRSRFSDLPKITGPPRTSSNTLVCCTTIDAGALPGLTVPLLARARNILRERAQPDSESGGCPVVPAL